MKKINCKNNICVVFFALIFISNGYVISAQKIDEKSTLTNAERKEAEEIATEFTLSFAKNKSIASNISLYYSQDFIQRYTAQVKKEAEDELWMTPFLIYRPALLLETKEPQLKEFYTVSHNFFLMQTLFILKKIEDDKNADIDKAVDELFSPKLKELLQNNPNTNELSGADSKKSKPISSLEELKNVIHTLSEAVKIVNESDQSVISETNVRKICKSFQSKGLSKTRAKITDEEYYKLPKGTKVISVVSPLMISLDLTKIHGKLKIIATQFYAE